MCLWVKPKQHSFFASKTFWQLFVCLPNCIPKLLQSFPRLWPSFPKWQLSSETIAVFPKTASIFSKMASCQQQQESFPKFLAKCLLGPSAGNRGSFAAKYLELLGFILCCLANLCCFLQQGFDCLLGLFLFAFQNSLELCQNFSKLCAQTSCCSVALPGQLVLSLFQSFFQVILGLGNTVPGCPGFLEGFLQISSSLSPSGSSSLSFKASKPFLPLPLPLPLEALPFPSLPFPRPLPGVSTMPPTPRCIASLL